jgi:hypothetical protein
VKDKRLVRTRPPQEWRRMPGVLLCPTVAALTWLLACQPILAQTSNPRPHTGGSGSPTTAISDADRTTENGVAVSGSANCRTQHFRVVCDEASSTGQAVGGQLECILPQLVQSMQSSGLAIKAPAEPLPWFCFDDREQYRRHTVDAEHMGVSFPESYYSTRTNHVVVYCGTASDPHAGATPSHLPDSSLHLLEVPSRPRGPAGAAATSSDRIVVLTHELAHQLAFSSGLQKPGVLYPLWVSEGLATCFERCALTGGRLDPNTIRRQRLCELGRSDRLLPLEELSVLGGPSALASAGTTEFQSSPVDVYAQCWGLFSFLLERYPRQLSAYLTDLARMPTGSRSADALRLDFITHFGSLDTLQTAWRQFAAADPAAAQEGSSKPSGVSANPGR